jgi:hypothetical protein
MPLTKPAGCILQIIGLNLILLGLGGCIYEADKFDRAPWVSLLLLVGGIVLIYLGTQPGRQAATIRERQFLETQRAVKPCPFCAEEILVDAVKCKHCRSDLT